MTDEEMQLELWVAISKYLKNPNKAPLKIVTVGRRSVGKSTLINNILNLPRERAAKARTTAVTKYEGTLIQYHGLVPVHIYDTPRLDGRIDESSVIKELRQKTEGSVDLLFYVASLQNRLEVSDERIIELLTNEFTPRVWEHAIFILSFADQHCHELDYEFTDKSTEVLQEYVCKQSGCKNLVVKCIRTMADREPIMNYNNVIAAIPTGQYENCDPEHWMSNLLVEVLRKSNEEPLLLCTGRSIVRDLAVGSMSLAAGGAVGGIAASIAGSTTTVSTTFMGIAVGVKTAATLNAVAGIVGTTATKTVVITTAASTGVVGVGVVGGVTVAVVGLGFKKYIWPIIRETY